MKTNFLQRNRRPSPYKKYLLIVIGIFFLGSIVFSFIKGPLLEVFTPVWKGENTIARGLNNLYLFFYTKNSLIAENQILKNKLNSDEILLASYRAGDGVEENLQKVFGRTPTTKGITSAVLVHPPETPYDILVIDVGSDHGVQVGNSVTLPVDNSSGLVGPKIGVVVEVFAKNSKVRLYSASGQKTDAILERNSLPISLLGRGGGNFEFILPRDASVEKGDKILSPELGRSLIGVVQDIEVTPTDSFKKILVLSVANIYTDNFVVVLP